MKKNEKRRGLPVLMALIGLALLAVLALIIWKQWEYGSSADFYSGLRGS